MFELAGKMLSVLSKGHSQWFYRPLPAPDGKYLAFEAQTYAGNVWMIDNF